VLCSGAHYLVAEQKKEPEEQRSFVVDFSQLENSFFQLKLNASCSEHVKFSFKKVSKSMAPFLRIFLKVYD